MKELDPPHKEEIREERQERRELRRIGHLVIPKGHDLWEYNFETKILRKARCMDDSKPTIDTSRGVIINGKIMFDERCHYLTALNLKNAIRKLNIELVFLRSRGFKV